MAKVVPVKPAPGDSRIFEKAKVVLPNIPPRSTGDPSAKSGKPRTKS